MRQKDLFYKLLNMDKSLIHYSSSMRQNKYQEYLVILEPRCEKNGLRGFPDQLRQKPDCTATEDGWRLEISDLGRRGIILFVKRKQRR